MPIKKSLSLAIERRGRYLNAIRCVEFGLLNRWLAPQRDDVICDLGCGLGAYSYAVSLRSRSCVGIDLDPEISRHAAALYRSKKCDFIAGNAEVLPFGDNHFSKILAVSAIEHFKNVERVLKETNRVLRPGGLLILSCDALNYDGISYLQRNSYMERHHVVSCYTIESLRQVMDRAGFEVLEMRYLINSPGASAVYQMGAKLKWGRLFSCCFPITYPIAWLSDRLFAKPGQGYFLALKARKPGILTVGC